MGSTGYRILGFLVWKGGRFYVRRMLRGKLPSRRVAAGATGVALAAAGAIVLAARRGEH